MSRALPPVPPANRRPKGPPALKDKDVQGKGGREAPPENTKSQGQQGNAWQNTHHQGHQQDR